MDPIAEFINYVVLTYVLPIASVLAIGALADLYAKARAYAKTKLTAVQLGIVDDIVKRGVNAVQQVYGSGDGKFKKAAALLMIQGEIEAHGVKNVDVDTLADWIEAAVKTELPKYPELVAVASPLVKVD